MTTSEMTDRDLDYALCEAMGFKVCRTGDTCLVAVPHAIAISAPHWHRDNDKPQYWNNYPPTYSTRLDALSAVEQRLRDAHLRQEVVWQPAAKAFHAEWGHFLPWGDGERFERWTAFNASESRARAEAALLALRAIEPTSITTLASRTED